MAERRAQVAAEFLIATFVALILLFFGVLVYALYNDTSEMIMEQKENMLECNKIADAVSEIYSSSLAAQKQITISKAATFNRDPANSVPGQIIVSQGTLTAQSCNYFGNAKYTTILDTTGFSLAAEKSYIVSKSGGLVLFTIVT